MHQIADLATQSLGFHRVLLAESEHKTANFKEQHR